LVQGEKAQTDTRIRQ